MNTSENITALTAWLTLTQSPMIKPSHVKKLLEHFGSAEAICRANTTKLQAQQLHSEQIQQIKHPNITAINRILAWQTNPNQTIIPITDSRYPTLLANISSAPLLLYVKGDPSALHRPQIAVVGSRNPTHTGLELAAEFGYLLATNGFVITSGLAMGIDTAAHAGALKAQGQTIAVLGNGLSSVYPHRNFALAEQISKQGCLVSEFPLDMRPTKMTFPQRNRVISGLSLGTVVIEAAPKSGSLITARFAAEQGREVFAIPGSIRNPLAKGCLNLIQDGAKCVTSIQDILDEIQIVKGNSPCENQNTPKQTLSMSDTKLTLDTTNNPVLACIDHDITTVDQICARSKLSAQLVSALLVQLELDGTIERRFGGFVKL